MKTQKQIPDISFLSSNIGCDLDDAYNEIIEQKAHIFSATALGQMRKLSFRSVGRSRVHIWPTEGFCCC